MKEEKIPTAEEFRNRPQFKFYEDNSSRDFRWDTVLQFARDFAKLHVEAALKATAEQVCIDWDAIDYIERNSDKLINKESILSAYPLENIK